MSNAATQPRSARDVLAEAAWGQRMLRLPGVFIPGLRVNNPLNGRKDWRPVARAAKYARTLVRDAMARDRVAKALPAVVTMTRYGKGTLDKDCGLNASLKPVRDGVADFFGVDDADPRYEWRYRQERAKWYGVRVLIEPAIPAEASRGPVG